MTSPKVREEAAIPPPNMPLEIHLEPSLRELKAGTIEGPTDTRRNDLDTSRISKIERDQTEKEKAKVKVDSPEQR